MPTLGDTIAKLVVEVKADVSDLDKSLGDGDGSVIKKVNDFGLKLVGVGAGMTAAITAPIVAFMASSVTAYGQQEQALADVEAAITSTSGVANQSLKDLQGFATELQKSSLFGDEEILKNVTAPLLTFVNITDEQFPAAQQAIVDMATRLGGEGPESLRSMAIQVGKALNNPKEGINALKRAGVEFEQKELILSLIEIGNTADAQRLMLDELGKQFGGAGAAAQDTLAGRIGEFQDTLGDLKENVGSVVGDKLDPLLTWGQNMLDKLVELNPETLNMATNIGLFLAAAGPGAMILGGLAMVISPMTVAVAALGGATATLALNWPIHVNTLKKKWANFKLEFLEDTRDIVTGMGWMMKGMGLGNLDSVIAALDTSIGNTKAELHDTYVERYDLLNAQGDGDSIFSVFTNQAKDAEDRARELTEQMTMSGGLVEALGDTGQAATEAGAALGGDTGGGEGDSFAARLEAAKRKAGDFKEMAIAPLNDATKTLKEKGIDPAALSVRELGQAAEDAAADFAGKNNEGSLWGSIHRTLDKLNGPGGFGAGIGDIIGDLTGRAGLGNALGGIASTLIQGGSFGDAVLAAAGAIPGIGTAIQGVSGVLAQFGIDAGAILDGVAEKAGEVVAAIGEWMGFGGTAGSKEHQLYTQMQSRVQELILEGMSRVEAAKKTTMEFRTSQLARDTGLTDTDELFDFLTGLNLKEVNAGFDAYVANAVAAVRNLSATTNDYESLQVALNRAMSGNNKLLNFLEIPLEEFIEALYASFGITQAELEDWLAGNTETGGDGKEWAEDGGGTRDLGGALGRQATESMGAPNLTVNMNVDGEVLATATAKAMPGVLNLNATA